MCLGVIDYFSFIDLSINIRDRKRQAANARPMMALSQGSMGATITPPITMAIAATKKKMLIVTFAIVVFDCWDSRSHSGTLCFVCVYLIFFAIPFGDKRPS